MASPNSQKADARPIAFTLHDTAKGSPPLTIPLFVRPEDLSITSPSRMAITQTFGEDGAWADSFGPGVKTISISGVTGWRGPRGEFGGDDGFEHFQKVHNAVFADWHKLREKALAAGNDPDKVLLILSDGLDNLNYVVAPQQFVLKRNRSRPLLAQYAITMHRLSDHVKEPAAKSPSAEAKKLSAVNSLKDSLKKFQNFATELKGMVSSVLAPIKEAIGKFVGLVSGICGFVVGVVKTVVGVVKGVVGELVGMAQNIARAGMNIAHTIAAVRTLPQQIRHEFQKLGSAFTNMVCVLKNVFKKRTFLPDYDIGGSGSCSSTAGGHPVSRYVSNNTFSSVMAFNSPLLTVSSKAASAISDGMNMDVTAAVPSVLGAIPTPQIPGAPATVETAAITQAGSIASAIFGGVKVDGAAAQSYADKVDEPLDMTGSLPEKTYAEAPVDGYVPSTKEQMTYKFSEDTWPGIGVGAPKPEGWKG